MSKSKSNSLKKVLAVLASIVIVVALGFVAYTLLKSHKNADTAATPRASTATIYGAIPLPPQLKFLEHQTTTSGTPSEVYYYSYTGTKQSVSDSFSTNLNTAGYTAIKGTDGLLFSASKAGSISLNFTFTDPDQLKVVAI